MKVPLTSFGVVCLTLATMACSSESESPSASNPQPSTPGSSAGTAGMSPSGGTSGMSSSGDTSGMSSTPDGMAGSAGSSAGAPSVTPSPECDPGAFTETGAAPDLGPRVVVIDPTMDQASVQAELDTLGAQQRSRDSEFGPNRYAVLIKPGTYSLYVEAGYYMQILGLGLLPGDVIIQGGVESQQVGDSALSMFWRAAENLTVVPSGSGNLWAASQAAPMRRLHIQGGLALSAGGYTSGGFLADSVIDGVVNSGTQQQYFSRNTAWGGWNGGVWNMMFVGVENPPAGQWPASPYTVIEQTPRLREKPFLHVDAADNYHVFVPALTENTVGPSWLNGTAPGASIPISDFYVAREDSDDAASLNAALACGKHLLFTPGKYYLDASLQVTQPGQVVLGLGYPSLIPTSGTTAMTVADVDNVSIAGVSFDAGPQRSPTLLEVGKEGSAADHSAAPSMLSDVYCRVGTTEEGATDSCVTINSDNVIADHFWLWRADHGPSATGGRPGWGVNVSPNGLIVNGDDVTIFGLFNEHFQEFQTLWNGEGGTTYFYQCEMPYDPPDQPAWSNNGVDGYAAYKVADHVTTHEAWGMGIYTTFQAAPVFAERAIEVPDAPGVHFRHMLSRYLSAGGGIRHVINDAGGEAVQGNPQGTVNEYNMGEL